MPIKDTAIPLIYCELNNLGYVATEHSNLLL